MTHEPECEETGNPNDCDCYKYRAAYERGRREALDELRASLRAEYGTR